MPAIAAIVAIFKGDEILLTKREDFEVWCLPGGGVEDNESVAEAAIREALEETGLEIRLTRLVGVYSRLGLYNQVHAILFAARQIGGKLQTQPGETIAVEFFSQGNIPEAILAGHQQRIQDAFSGAGGSVVRTQTLQLAKGQPPNRQELYDLRDSSGLPPQQFYLENFILVNETLDIE